jgi:hypothetical protein
MRRQRRSLRCECGTWFAPRWANQAHCPPCLERACRRLTQRRDDPAHAAWEMFQSRLYEALEPFLGQSEVSMPKLLTRLHGVFGAPEKAK